VLENEKSEYGMFEEQERVKYCCPIHNVPLRAKYGSYVLE
jgi:hypothetical protein